MSNTTFTNYRSLPVLGIVSIIGWNLWLLILAWRAKEPTRSPGSQPKFAQD
ncbi:MAG TPA: hypothetical protein VK897_19150 [Anaerolineales bacterium]|nr:hypothetical protein [Anaerolineales bacterium]